MEELPFRQITGGTNGMWKPLMILLGAQLPRAKIAYFCLPLEALLNLLAYGCFNTCSRRSKEQKQNEWKNVFQKKDKEGDAE